ncbi:phosphatidylserine decarboxylase family protein [Candidatus Poribacteria bacterium]|nr:phosphatidylserine decarboxylase family protein [Candidatus Poribacteria bacterium]
MSSKEAWMSVARPAWIYFIPLALLSLLMAFLYWPVGVLFGVLAFYVLYFFRDPRRQTPNIPGCMISPADGKVVSVIEIPCPEMPGGRALRLAVFLNVFDVHIQRASAGGEVTDVKRRAGKFLNALNEKCSEENEQVTVWLKNDECVFGIRQIAGAIARRIVCNVKDGDHLERGERYGLIQFGSRVELFLPTTATVKVQPGQRVKGGETCVALLYEEEVRKGRPASSGSNAAVKSLAEVG